MSEMDFDAAGLDFMEDLLSKFQVTDEEVLSAMETGAKMLVADVRKLPKPRSEVRKAGYTHLLDSVTYRKTKKEIEVGWRKYYGPMVENGTIRARATSHMAPTFKTNQKRYYGSIEKEIWK